ncbi:MAG: F0F1 ATP synthase subunit epsilon [Chthoniobacterales bacterium]
MESALMHLKILLPFEIFAEKDDVKRIVVETNAGSFGLLPHRLDCTAALVPGILIFETVESGEQYVAVAEGALMKTDLEVSISVRNAIAGTDLQKLREAVEQDFKHLDERERNVRLVLAKLESSFARRFLEFQHG